MNNYFQGSEIHPRHVSVGAVLVNDGSTGSPQESGKICVHHFDSKNGSEFAGYWKDQGLDDFYILMRETVEMGETLERAVHRGLLEEFGAEAEIVDYLGSIQIHFKHKGSEVEIEKTTLYFLCKLKNQDLNKRSKGDVECESVLEWHDPKFLITKMKAQGAKFNRQDLDESVIFEKLNI